MSGHALTDNGHCDINSVVTGCNGGCHDDTRCDHKTVTMKTVVYLCGKWNSRSRLVVIFVGHIYASVNLAITASGNGLSPACPSTSHYLNKWYPIVIFTLRNKVHWNVIENLKKKSFKKMHLEMSSAKRQPFCFGLYLLMSAASSMTHPPPLTARRRFVLSTMTSDTKHTRNGNQQCQRHNDNLVTLFLKVRLVLQHDIDPIRQYQHISAREYSHTGYESCEEVIKISYENNR